MRRSLRSNYVSRSRSPQRQHDGHFSVEKYGAKTREKKECDEQLLAEYASLLGFYVASVAVLTGMAMEQNRLPKRFGLLDLALLGIATHKLSRIVAKDRITSILRAPFVNYIRSAGAGEVEEEPRGRGIQRGIGQLYHVRIAWRPGAQRRSVLALSLRHGSPAFWPGFWRL